MGVLLFIHGLILLAPNLLLMVAVGVVCFAVGSVFIEEENLALGIVITISTAISTALAIIGIWGW